MSGKKQKATSRTKSGTLSKTAVAKAVKIVSSKTGKEVSTKKSTFVCRDAKSGNFLKPTETSSSKTSRSAASSALRTKSGTLKRTIVKDAVESVTRSRSSYEKKK